MWLCHVSWSLGQLQLLGRVHLIGPTWFSGPPLIEQHGLLAVVLLCGKPFQSARDWNDDWKRVQPNLFKVKEKCNRTQGLAQSLVFHVCLFVLRPPPPPPRPRCGVLFSGLPEGKGYGILLKTLRVKDTQGETRSWRPPQSPLFCEPLFCRLPMPTNKQFHS